MSLFEGVEPVSPLARRRAASASDRSDVDCPSAYTGPALGKRQLRAMRGLCRHCYGLLEPQSCARLAGDRFSLA